MAPALPRPPALTRRALLAACAALPAAAPAALPDAATLMVAGPMGGVVDGWADLLAPLLGRALPPGTTIRKDTVGGMDGVTGANQFDARAVPDGSTALLLPGDAPFAWLVGDSRAHFDPSHWVPTFSAVTPSVLLSRVTLRDAQAGTPLRVGAARQGGEAAAAMLALDLLGIRWQPVFGVAGAALEQALAANTVQAVLLTGRQVSAQVRRLASTGSLPMLTFGGSEAPGERTRDPAFPNTPCLDELLGGRQVDPALLRGWRSLAATTMLDVAMVLPQLTPAALVAVWRRAVAQVLASGAMQTALQTEEVRPLANPAVASAALSASPAAQLALRGWLADRLHYRPL